MSIKSLSIFELLESILRLNEQLRLHNKAFPIPYLSDFFHRSATKWVVYIEMVPI